MLFGILIKLTVNETHRSRAVIVKADMGKGTIGKCAPIKQYLLMDKLLIDDVF